MALIRDYVIAVSVVLLIVLISSTVGYAAWARYTCRKRGHKWDDDRERCVRCGHEFHISKRYKGPWS